MREGGFDAAFLAVGAHIGKRAYIPAGEAARILDAVSLLRSMEGEREAAARPPGRRLRRRQHGDGRGPHREAARRRRGDRRLPAHPRPDARPRLRGRGGRGGGRDDALARRRSSRSTRASSRVEKMELDETGFPQPTGELEELEADSLVLALGQEADLSLLDGVPGHRGRGRRRPGRAEHDDRARGRLRRRRHGPGRAHRHGRRRPRQEGRAQHRRLAARSEPTSRRPSTSSPPSTQLNTWYYADAPSTCSPQLEIARRRVHLRRGGRRARRVERAVRGAALHVLRQLLLLRQLLRRLPRQRGDQAGRAAETRTSTATRSTSTSARAAASASRSAPAARSRWSPRRSDEGVRSACDRRS